MSATSEDADTSSPSEPMAAGSATDSSTATSLSTGERPRVMVAFFSRAGENYCYGERIDLEVGNTAAVARIIREALTEVGVDVTMHEIEAAQPYSDDYDDTVERNVREQDADARPAIAGPLPDTAAYDVVLLGSGIWNVRPPMIMSTFVEGVDLSDARVHAFVTYAVSGLGAAESVYAAQLRGVEMGEPLAVQGEEARASRGKVEAWLTGIGLLG